MYFYKHTNGDIIRQVDIVVDADGGPGIYYDSPFVVEWWHVEDDEEEEE